MLALRSCLRKALAPRALALQVGDGGRATVARREIEAVSKSCANRAQGSGRGPWGRGTLREVGGARGARSAHDCGGGGWDPKRAAPVALGR